MSNENGFMAIVRKNPVTTGMVTFAVLSILIIVIVMMMEKNNTPKPTTKEGFSFSDTFSLSNMTDEDADHIVGGGYEENGYDYEKEEIVENFPQPAPMNVMYSDANGNLATTTDLGLQNLTIAGGKDAALLIGNKFRFNANKDFWGDDKWLRMSNADNTGYSGSGPDGGFAAQNLYAADTIYAQTANIRGNSNVAGSISATGSISAGSISTGGSLSAGTTNVGQFTAGSISSNANISAGGKLQEGGNALIPRGTIVMWNGAAAPAGWAICDGGNSTPDLRDKFIVGAGNSYGLAQTGGASEVTLTVDQMPAHNHIKQGRETLKLVPAGSHQRNLDDGNYSGIDSVNGALHTLQNSFENTGGNQPHENRPPFYALCYIMKL